MSTINFDMSGLENLSNRLNSLSKRRSVQIGDMLTNSFITSHSKFNSLDSFMSACGIHNSDEFKSFPDTEMDKFVQANTNFSSWQDMLGAAGAEYYKKQLGL